MMLIIPAKSYGSFGAAGVQPPVFKDDRMRALAAHAAKKAERVDAVGTSAIIPAKSYGSFDVARAQPPVVEDDRVIALAAHAAEIADRVDAVGTSIIYSAASQIASKKYDKGWYKERFKGSEFIVYQPSKEGMPLVYLIGKKLGEGVFSTVHKIHLLNTGKTAVLKKDKIAATTYRLINTLTYLNPGNSRHLGIERAPHYSEPYQLNENGVEEVGLIEDLADGGDCYHNPPRNNKEFAKFLSDISAGYRYFHNRINHGDLKPENILRTEGEYVVADWGSSKKYDDLKEKFLRTRRIFLEGTLRLSMKEKLANARDAVRHLADTYTEAYCSKEDWDILLRAFIKGDWERFEQIERSRDVFAFGATIISALDPETYYDDCVWYEIVDKGDYIKAEGMERLSPKMFNQLRNRGLSDDQILMVDRMLRESDKRPTVEEIYTAFYKSPEELERNVLQPTDAEVQQRQVQVIAAPLVQQVQLRATPPPYDVPLSLAQSMLGLVRQVSVAKEPQAQQAAAAGSEHLTISPASAEKPTIAVGKLPGKAHASPILTNELLTVSPSSTEKPSVAVVNVPRQVVGRAILHASVDDGRSFWHENTESQPEKPFSGGRYCNNALWLDDSYS